MIFAVDNLHAGVSTRQRQPTMLDDVGLRRPSFREDMNVRMPALIYGVITYMQAADTADNASPWSLSSQGVESCHQCFDLLFQSFRRNGQG
jgi:hypothetical protein